MSKKHGVVSAAISVALSFIIALSVCLSAFARVKEPFLTPEQMADKAKIVETFNNSVNAVKTLKPSFKYTSTYGMDEESMKSLGTPQMAVALELLVAAIMGDLDLDSALGGSITQGTTVGSGSKKFSVGKGQNTTDLIPVTGKSYVSALDADDEFEFAASFNKNSGNTVITLTLPSVSRSDARGTSLSKVFDLLDEEAIIRFNSNSKYALRLDYFTVEYVKPQVEALIDGDGRLVRYTTVLDYQVGINKDSLGVVGFASTVAQAIMGIVSDTGGSLDFTNFNEALNGLGGMILGTQGICTYRRIISLTNFDWYAKMYGDLDDSRTIEAADARLALRAALDIDQIKGDFDFIAADVDRDGFITAADARLILRVALEIDGMFSPETEGWIPGSGIIPEPEEIEPDPADLDDDEILDWEIGLRSTAPTEEDTAEESATEPLPEESTTVPETTTVPATVTTTEKRGYTLREETTKSNAQQAGEVVSQIMDLIPWRIG